MEMLRTSPLCGNKFGFAERASSEVSLKDLCRSVPQHQQRIERVALISHLHARRTDWHARNRQAKGIRPFGEQSLHITGRHVTFDGVPNDKRRMAGG